MITADTRFRERTLWKVVYDYIEQPSRIVRRQQRPEAQGRTIRATFFVATRGLEPEDAVITFRELLKCQDVEIPEDGTVVSVERGGVTSELIEEENDA